MIRRSPARRRTHADPKTFADRLSQRIAGIAASNNLLVSGKWQGVEVERLIDSQLSPFVDLGARVVLDGPPLRLTPAAAQALGMALHELATNAVKHGRPHRRAGKIRIHWLVPAQPAAPEFRMTWAEQGGPPVPAPQRTGFGRTVMERMIAGTLGGTAALRIRARRHRLDVLLPGAAGSGRGDIGRFIPGTPADLGSLSVRSSMGGDRFWDGGRQ